MSSYDPDPCSSAFSVFNLLTAHFLCFSSKQPPRLTPKYHRTRVPARSYYCLPVVQTLQTEFIMHDCNPRIVNSGTVSDTAVCARTSPWETTNARMHARARGWNVSASMSFATRVRVQRFFPDRTGCPVVQGISQTVHLPEISSGNVAFHSDPGITGVRLAGLLEV